MLDVWPQLVFFGPFPYLGSAYRVFNLHVRRSGASSIFTCFSFVPFLITSLHLSFSLPTYRYPPTSIFHILITTPSSVRLSTWPNHLSLASLIVSLMFAPHLPLLLFLHSWYSHSSLFPSSISAVSFLYYLASFAQPFQCPCLTSIACMMTVVYYAAALATTIQRCNKKLIIMSFCNERQ